LNPVLRTSLAKRLPTHVGEFWYFFVEDGLGYWPHSNVSYKSWKWRIWKLYVTQRMQRISSLHCIAVTESLSYCVYHHSRSTSAGIFMARLHSTAIFCSCQFLIVDSRPTFRNSAYSKSDRRTGASPRPPNLRGRQVREMRSYFRRFLAVFDSFSSKWRARLFAFPVFSLESYSSWWTVSQMTYILTSYLGEFSRFSGSKWRLKLFPFPVFTPDSNFSSSSLLKTTYISIGIGDVSRYRGQNLKISKNI